MLALTLAACTIRAPKDSATQIDACLTDLAQRQQFSGAVLVAREGQILLSKGYGMADIENGVPNTPQTRFRIGQVTAQFTAMAILMLQAQGKLSVGDPICRYVVDCPDYWQEITIHHLLTHTSGISDWIQPWDSSTGTPSTSPELVARLRYDPPYFRPGEKLRYSNNGYIVLGYIVEKVSGQPYETFLQQHVFGPLGMSNSGYGDDRVALGYQAIGVKAPVPDLLFRFSASGLYSSVEDLYRWDQALYGEQLIPRQYLDMMFTGYAKTPSIDFAGAYYGYGWFVGNLLVRSVIGHGGKMAGFTAMLLRFPDERVTIIVLRNYGIPAYDRLEIEVAKMVFGEHSEVER